jgi:hypothetical protein
MSGRTGHGATGQEQGSINWAQAGAAGIQFTAIKATEGASYVNPYASADLAAARAAGLATMAYAFAILNGDGASASAVAQADYFLAHAAGTDGHVPSVMLDIEYDPYSGSDGTNQCYGLSKSAMRNVPDRARHQGSQRIQGGSDVLLRGGPAAVAAVAAGILAGHLGVTGHQPDNPDQPMVADVPGRHRPRDRDPRGHQVLRRDRRAALDGGAGRHDAGPWQMPGGESSGQGERNAGGPARLQRDRGAAMAPDPEGSGVMLVNPRSDRCLTDPSAATANGTRLVIEPCAATPGKVWRPA